MESTWTIIVSDGAVVVVEGREPKSRLHYWGANVEVYLLGAVKVSRRDIVRYEATQIFLRAHVPLIQMRANGWM